MLTAWDAHSDADSAAAALYEIWVERHLRSAVVDAVVPAAACSCGAPRKSDRLALPFKLNTHHGYSKV
jgi:acyl-homoserine lactone acylase PvdQ